MAAAASARGGRSRQIPHSDWTLLCGDAGSGKKNRISVFLEVGNGAWWNRLGWGTDASSMRARRGPSQKGTDQQPSKKLRCEKKTLAKLDVRQGIIQGRASHRFLSKKPAKKPSLESGSLGLKTMLQSEAKRILKTEGGMGRDPDDLCAEASALGTAVTFPKTGSQAILRLPIPDIEGEEEDGEEKEEEGHGVDLSDDSEMEPEETENPVFEVDNSAFLNEDSNQPLPVDRFFGSVAFMQDLPAPPLTRAIGSRREFRKAHFIAKDDDDDDEEEEEVI